MSGDDEFDAITRDHAIERTPRDTARNITPPPQQMAAPNRSQITPRELLAACCASVALLVILGLAVIGAAYLISSLTGWF